MRAPTGGGQEDPTALRKRVGEEEWGDFMLVLSSGLTGEERSFG